MDHIVWDSSPVIFSLGGFKIRWYSVFFALTFYLGYKFMEKVFAEKDRAESSLEPLLWHVAVGTIVGARLGHCLFYEPDYYLSRPLEILMVWKGGLASHGGAAGIFIGLTQYCKKYKESLIWTLDHLSIPMALGACFIRLGNFFNSEILGNVTDVPWAIIFKKVDSFPRHPAQLYESFSYLIIFLILITIYRKSKSEIKPGKMFGFFIFAVFTARFFIEFIKIRQEVYDTTLALNTGQLLSIPFIFSGLYLCLFYKKKEKKIPGSW